MPKTDLCAAAKSLAARKFRVFPLQSNSKIPPKGSWLAAVSDVEDRIDSVFQNMPQANIGIATGQGLMVLDFDTKNGQQGLQSRFVLEAMGLPDTLESATPSGGVHLYFNVDASILIHNSIGRIAPGVDVRGHHGYVVAPPSVIDGRNYQWVDPDRQIADAPDWLVQMCVDVQQARRIDAEEPLGPIDTPEALARGTDWLRESAPTAVEGDHGDITTFKVAATLKDFGLGIDTTFDLMAEHWNPEKAIPPWDPDDLLAKVESAFHSGRNRPGSANAAAQFGAVDLLETLKDSPAPKRRMFAVDFDESASLALASAGDPLVDDLLDKQGMSMIYGKWGQGKSFVALDIAYCVATGRPWNGHSVEHGLVVYLAAEGGTGIHKRMAALRKVHGPGARLVVVPCPANLLSGKKDTADLMEIIKDAEARWNCRAAMVVVDTVSRVLVGGDENSSVDLGKLVANLTDLKEAIAAHVMLIHHAGKDLARGARGHSNLPAALETEIVVDKSTFKVTKQRDDEMLAPLSFKLERVELGTNGRGRPVSSCVVRWGDADEFSPIVPLPAGTAAEQMWLAFVDAAKSEAAGEADWQDVSITTKQWSDAYLNRLKTRENVRKDVRSKGDSRSYISELRKIVTEHGYVQQTDKNQWVAVDGPNTSEQ